MWSNQQFTADLVTFTEEILNGKLYCFAVQWGSKKEKICVAGSKFCRDSEVDGNEKEKWSFPTIYIYFLSFKK